MEPQETEISTTPLPSLDADRIPLPQIEEKQRRSCFEGESLTYLLTTLGKIIESERCKNKVLPEKLWFKQHFAIGVNEVTRILERMRPVTESTDVTDRTKLKPTQKGHHVGLQAVFVASDCNPRWLTRHLPTLAASRNVPLIQVKDKKEGSLRLGQLVKLKTAIAIGVKAKSNQINQLTEEILHGDEETCEEEERSTDLLG